MNINNNHHKCFSENDRVELGLFILRYLTVLALLVLGFIGPAVQRSAYGLITDEEVSFCTNVLVVKMFTHD